MGDSALGSLPVTTRSLKSAACFRVIPRDIVVDTADGERGELALRSLAPMKPLGLTA